MIEVDKSAADKIREIAEDEELTGQHLRVKVIGGGCAGFNYDLFFEDSEPLPLDEVFESNGVTIVVDPLSFQYLDGSLITYTETVYGAGFRFSNPNVTSTCGCGSSVGF
jgi:iron-sulfur cluster insertion protein